eukprot:4004466-Pyramimonas_sp.AAC.1
MQKLFSAVVSEPTWSMQIPTRVPAVTWLTVYRRFPVPRKALWQDELRGIRAQDEASWPTRS